MSCFFFSGLNANPSRKEVCWIETSSGNIMCAGYGTTRTFSQFNLSGEVLGEVELTSYGQEMIYSVGNGHMYTASYDSGEAKFLWNASEPISYLKHSGVYSKVDHGKSCFLTLHFFFWCISHFYLPSTVCWIHCCQL